MGACSNISGRCHINIVRQTRVHEHAVSTIRKPRDQFNDPVRGSTPKHPPIGSPSTSIVNHGVHDAPPFYSFSGSACPRLDSILPSSVGVIHYSSFIHSFNSSPKFGMQCEKSTISLTPEDRHHRQPPRRYKWECWRILCVSFVGFRVD
jgi:hypothetical protein